MEPSEQVNLPTWQGEPGHFEIWFVVAIDLEAARATWVRYTTFSPVDGPARAAVWAADFDAKRSAPAIWAKSTHGIDAYSAAADRFRVRIGDSEIRHGACTGRVASAGHSLAWDLSFAVGSAPVRRTPAVLEQVRLATTSVHACVDAPATGWIEIDGQRRELVRGKAVQMHLFGTRRVDNLSWIWAPALAAEQASLEVISAQTRRAVAGVPAPHMTSLFLRHGDELEDLTQLPDALLPTSSSPAPGVLEVSFTGLRRALRVRAYAAPEAYAGWVYRHPSTEAGRDLHVAQSDIASCVVESFRRRHPLGRWHPDARLLSRQRAAVELHGYSPIEGIRYVGWDESEPLPTRPPERPRARPPLAAGGELVELSAPTAIVAAGLTFAGHRAEVGAAAPEPGEAPQMFLKAAGTWAPESEVVALPSYRALLRAADEVEPGLAEVLRARYPALPALLDYEVELAMAVLEPIAAGALAAGKLPRLGWCVVNDLTARALQILGEGRSAPPYWAAAKSFAGFLPAVSTAWVAAHPVDAPPRVLLRTLVNGQVRQETLATELAFRPSQLLVAAAAALGRDLAPGDLVLTGTPAGVALRVPRWKRRLSRMLDRFGKLDAAIGLYVEGGGFLRCGDRVTVDAEVLGARTVEIGMEDEEPAP